MFFAYAPYIFRFIAYGSFAPAVVVYITSTPQISSE